MSGKKLKDVSCPVLLVSGDADAATPATSKRPGLTAMSMATLADVHDRLGQWSPAQGE